MLFSATNAQDDRGELVLPPFQTLSLAHPRRAAAERRFGAGRFQRIAWSPEGPIGACRQTVARTVALRGGRPIPGWQIHIWPGLFIEALFHFVWADDAGVLTDLSAKYPTDPRRYSVFAPDRIQPPPADPHSRHFVLTAVPEVQVLIEAARRQAENRRAVETRIRRARPNVRGLLLEQASPSDRALLDEDEAWVGVAISACLRLSQRIAKVAPPGPDRSIDRGAFAPRRTPR
jgi:hypothetical protein